MELNYHFNNVINVKLVQQFPTSYTWQKLFLITFGTSKQIAMRRKYFTSDEQKILSENTNT